MNRRVRLTRRAAKKLDNILEFLDNNFGDIVAKRFLERTYSLFDILIEFLRLEALKTNKKVFMVS